MKLPPCLCTWFKGTTLVACKEPAEFWDCSDPVGGPVCERHACARHGGKQKLSHETLAEMVKEYGEANAVV